jgi:iron complex transport system substrate-binding protein
VPTRSVHRSARLLRAVLPVLALAGALTGCATHSDAGAAPSSAAAPGFPATVTLPGAKPVSIPAKPKRIVSLDPSDTEVLFAIGAGPQVVAVDKDSDYPANAPHSQLDATKPSVEAIAKDNPDLVVATYDSNGLVAGLQKLKIPVLLVTAPTTVAGAYGVWNALGTATGHAPEAGALVTKTKATLAKIVRGTRKPAKPLSYYYELDPTYYTATSHTFIGQLLGQFGLTNIADPADTPAAAGYPQLSAEKIVAADPDLIILADTNCCGQNASTVAGRPGWSTLDAVRDGGVVPLDDDIASRWGPRITDLVQTVSTAISKEAA